MAEPGPCTTEQAALEEAVRQQARHTPGGEPERIEVEVDLDRLVAMLGDRHPDADGRRR
jgi:hypothetical protein